MPQERKRAKPRDAEPGDGSEPRVKVIWDDVPRGIERDDSKGVHSRSVRCGDDDPQEHRVPNSTSGPYEIGSYYRLSMARLQCVERTQSRGDDTCREQDPKTDPLL